VYTLCVRVDSFRFLIIFASYLSKKKKKKKISGSEMYCFVLYLENILMYLIVVRLPHIFFFYLPICSN
jgi:hypothetical protein